MLPQSSPQRKTHFLVPFEGWKMWEMNQGSESLRKHMGFFSCNCRRNLVSNEARVSLQKEVALGLVSVHWVEYPLQTWCFQTLVGDVCEMSILPWLFSSVVIFPDMAKKDFSYQVRPFLYREHFWNAFQEKESASCTPVLREGEAVHGCPCHSDRRSWFGTEARVVFLSQEALGMESLFRGECMKHLHCLQSLVFWFCLDGHSALFVQTSLVLFSLLVQTRHGHAQTTVSWMENLFEVLFRNCRVMHKLLNAWGLRYCIVNFYPDCMNRLFAVSP